MKAVPLIATFLPLILAVVILMRIPVEPVYIEVPVPYMVSAEGPESQATKSNSVDPTFECYVGEDYSFDCREVLQDWDSESHW